MVTFGTSDERYPYLSPAVADLVSQQRAAMSGLVEPEVGGINLNGDQITWHTYAGGRVNSTLRYAIRVVEPTWSVTPDNFTIRVRDNNITEAHFQSVIRQINSPGFWTDETVWQQIQAALPGYRLSKFQPLMPAWVEQEVLFDYLLDRQQTADWLQRVT